MLDIQYQCFTPKLQLKNVPMFLFLFFFNFYFVFKLQFIGVSRTNLKEKKPDFFTFNFAFTFSLKTRTPEEPSRSTNDIKINPIQKCTDKFIVLIRRTCPGLHKNILTPIRL